MAKHSPTPWRIANRMHETIVDAQNRVQASAANAEVAALIVEAINEREGMKLDLADERMRSDRLLQQLSNEASDAARLRDKLRHEIEAYNDLRDLVRRLAEYIRHSINDCGGPWDIEIKSSDSRCSYHGNANALLDEARKTLGEHEP